MKKEKIQNVLKELENIPIESFLEQKESEEQRRNRFLIQEYKSQEEYLNKLLMNEQTDLLDYITMKTTRIDILKEMIEDTKTKRNTLEVGFNESKK